MLKSHGQKWYNCKSPGAIFARIGGVFGKNAKYEDADFIERIIKDRNKYGRKNMKQPEKNERVLLWYSDENDRNWVIAQCEKDINVALQMQDFNRCYEIQEYIKFVLDGFLALKNANNSDCNDGAESSNGDEELLRGNTTCHTMNTFQRVTRRASFEELCNTNGSDGAESSNRSFAHPRLQEKNLPVPNCPYREIVSAVQNRYEILRGGRTVSVPDIVEYVDTTPSDKNDSEKKAHNYHNKRHSEIITQASRETGTVQKILACDPCSKRMSVKQETFVEGEIVARRV